MKISRETLRIIDANLNRIGEGLRFLEELARMTLDDAALTQRLKDMRHDVSIADMDLKRQLLEARDSCSDVGAAMDVTGGEEGRGMAESLVANARRAQESLRVMEEAAKEPGLGLDAGKYRRARFALYTIEKDLFARFLRQDNLRRLAGLYVIVDTGLLAGRSCRDVAAQAIWGGAKVIQLRDKRPGKKELLETAIEMKGLCAEFGVLFIMNDYLDVALAADADGLHIGPDDLPVAVARRLLPRDKLLGCSARTVAKAWEAVAGGADYVAAGAIYPTDTKAGAEVVGIARLEEIIAAVSVPVVAIGGINRENIGPVMAAGAAAAAVIGAVMGAEDVAEAARRLSRAIEGESYEQS